MRKTFLVMRAEISATLRRKTFLFFAFVLPMALGLVAGVVMFINILIFESPDSPVAVALSFFPLTSPIAMIARLVTTDVPFWQPALAALILVVSVIFTVRLTARMFRAQILLSGQPFSVRGYYKTLLGRAS
jgi:ABC-2 type transport system permease protein